MGPYDFGGLADNINQDRLAAMQPGRPDLRKAFAPHLREAMKRRVPARA